VPVDSASYAAKATVTVLGNSGSLTKTNYAFSGWNTAADGSGTTYVAGATFTMASASVTLYAYWVPVPTYKVTYNGNGATSGDVPVDSAAYVQNTVATVLGNTGNLVEDGFVFAGWNTASDGSGTTYYQESSLNVSANVTLYALWTDKTTYTVSYRYDGVCTGTVPVDTVHYLDGAKTIVLKNSGNLQKDGYAFNGWNTASDGTGTSYAAGDTITIDSSDVTLYAVWKTNILSITVTTPGTVTVTLTISSNVVTQGNALSASVATSSSVDSYLWYLDGGSPVSGQTTSSFSGGASLGVGLHTLTAVVMKNGVAYSASGRVAVQ
jgi:Listeria-Bacteroides repeat domain (List_Bact_rpt).